MQNNNLFLYRFYVGMFDKDTKQQELSSTEFFNTVRKILRLNHIDNYTIIKCKGHYKSDTMVVCEPSIIIEIIDNCTIYLLNRLDSIKMSLLNELNQESILITKQSIEVL